MDIQEKIKTGKTRSIFLLVILFLVIVLLAVTTVKMVLIKDVLNCQYHPEVFCSNKWTCATFTTPPVEGVSSCFSNSAYAWNSGNLTDGLPECLFGPTSEIATTGSGSTSLPDFSLTCQYDQNTLPSVYNCSEGCPLSLATVPGCTGSGSTPAPTT